MANKNVKLNVSMTKKKKKSSHLFVPYITEKFRTNTNVTEFIL